ncbi:hypothetical protein EW145_g5408 [Phellinidium pouzarii]|uniref:HAM1-like N-terminal domain-containing protein n=1 Tax=Phellinidium pouzarii TaxID=167371 RepID=A0A4S4L0N1_9AGAM|nr:hypothetical protein EW145_g5408 [Phellinidium pouzarii]
MGVCFSCCRGRDKQTNSEREPLLRPSTDQQAYNSPLEKAADILAALHAGKLPSQQQIDKILKKFLRSNFLDGDTSNDGSLSEDGKRVIADVRNLVEIILQAGLEKNHDNRLQDLIYNIHRLSSTVEVIRLDGKMTKELKTAAAAIPSQDELASDTAALLASLRTLASLFLTSSAFRLLLGDLLLTAREMVADLAEQVKTTAATVEDVAGAIEIDMRPINYQEVVEVKDRPDSNILVEELEERKSVKNVVLDRMEDIFRQAQSSPSQNSALRTLLYLLRKYATRVRLASIPISNAASETYNSSTVQLSAPVNLPDPRFGRVLEDLKSFLERFAGGSGLDPLLTALSKSVHDIVRTPEDSSSKKVQLFFDEIGSWLDKALTDPSFTTSRHGLETASRIYDNGHELLSRDVKLSHNLEDLLDKTIHFIDALKSDRTTNRLAHLIDTLHNDALLFFGHTAQHAATHWRTTLVRSAFVWALPRFLRAIRTLPMPRVEYVSTRSNGIHVAATLDALLLSAEEALVPDVLSIQEWGEVRIEIDENLAVAEVTSPNAQFLGAREATLREDLGSILPIPGTNNLKQPGAGPSKATKATKVSSTSRVCVHVEGMRVAAYDVGYYGLYQLNNWLGYEDEGLISIEVGRMHRRNEGFTVDIELEVDLEANSQPSVDTRGNEDRRLFRVLDVHTAAPGLSLRLARSKHWILNSLLLPFVGSLGRTFGPRILDFQIRSVLEKLEETLRGVKDDAEKKVTERGRGGREIAKVGAWDWWDALLGRFGADDGESDEEDEEEEDHDVYTESHTEATMKGVVHTNVVQPKQLASPGAKIPPPSESTYAVGLSAQLLPGKGEPVGYERETLAEGMHDLAGSARGAVDDIQEALGEASDSMHGMARWGVENTIETRQALNRAGIRMKKQERSERKGCDWRSSAFNL